MPTFPKPVSKQWGCLVRAVCHVGPYRLWALFGPALVKG